MSQKQNSSNQKKKIGIIMLACFLVLISIVAIIVTITVHLQNKNNELSKATGNILYYNEGEENEEQEEGEDDILVVEIDDTNETTENETTSNTVAAVDAPYYIKINVEANVVTIYKKDSSGNYTTPVKAMICSVGTATPTSGVYTISDKYTWRLLQGGVYGQYACRITGHILFHSVPYISKDKSTLEWWEYDKLGTAASLGCIRLTVADAKWIYDNCVSGTQVEFYESSDPGPLGKPTAQKISDDTEVRNWDPTDPDENNPWTEYLANKVAEEASTNVVEEDDDEVENTVEETNAAAENTVVENVITNGTENTVDNTNTSDNNTVTKENSITSATVSENTIANENTV